MKTLISVVLTAFALSAVAFAAEGTPTMPAKTDAAPSKVVVHKAKKKTKKSKKSAAQPAAPAAAAPAAGASK